MKKRSHRVLGEYLAERYMADVPPLTTRIFVFGCVEPDYNYASYLKGWNGTSAVKGHNYECACRYINRIGSCLSEKDVWNVWDYYQFGRMLHYLADAFTFPHNSHFDGNLADHVRYELEMQPLFLQMMGDLRHDPVKISGLSNGIMNDLKDLHDSYMTRESTPEQDCEMILQTACAVSLAFVPAKEYQTLGLQRLHRVFAGFRSMI